MSSALFPLAVLAGVPEAERQTVSTDEDTALPIVLTASRELDVDVTAFSPGSPGHGSLISSGSIKCNGVDPVSCSQEFTYTPDQDYNGSDSFSFTADVGRQRIMSPRPSRSPSTRSTTTRHSPWART